jgi:rod shape-determining protein MreC
MLQFFFKRKKIIFLLFLFITSLSLFVGTIENKNFHSPFDKIILNLFEPPLKFTSLLINKTSQLWVKYFFLLDLREENTSLKKLLFDLETENQLLREQSLENEHLRNFLSFKEKLPYKVIPAEIIGRDPTSWFKTILVDKGSSDGIRKGVGVITLKGIVGMVDSVSKNNSKVLLITDINSSVDAIIKRSQIRGIVEGFSENSCKLSYVIKTDQINQNDSLVCSGQHGIYPKGVLVGSVKKTNKNSRGFFQFVEVIPSVDFSKLRRVLIVLK